MYWDSNGGLNYFNHPPPEHTGVIKALASSDYRKILVSGSPTDKTIKLWDYTANLRHTYSDRDGCERVSTMSLFSDTQTFVSGSEYYHTIKHWDFEHPNPLRTLSQGIRTLKALSDPNLLIAGYRNEIGLWDIRTRDNKPQATQTSYFSTSQPQLKYWNLIFVRSPVITEVQ